MNLSKRQAAGTLCRAGLLVAAVLCILGACNRSGGGAAAASAEKGPVNISWVAAGLDSTMGATEGEHYQVFSMDWNNDGKPAPVAPTVDVVLSINKDGKHVDETWDFVKWYVTEGVKNIIEYNLQYLPVQAGYTADVSVFSEEAQKNITEMIRIMQQQAYGYR
jgi:hypothetical protein